MYGIQAFSLVMVLLQLHFLYLLFLGTTVSDESVAGAAHAQDQLDASGKLDAQLIEQPKATAAAYTVRRARTNIDDDSPRYKLSDDPWEPLFAPMGATYTDEAGIERPLKRTTRQLPALVMPPRARSVTAHEETLAQLRAELDTQRSSKDNNQRHSSILVNKLRELDCYNSDGTFRKKNHKCSALKLSIKNNVDEATVKRKIATAECRIKQYEQLIRTIGDPDRSPVRCHLGNCFNWTKCNKAEEFSIYVYPPPPNDSNQKLSPTMQAILQSIRSLPYVTRDPQRACILVPNVDTLDRDPLSPNYNPAAEEELLKLPYWNDGLNHLIFVQFTGTYPDYLHSLDFDPRQAMIAGSYHTTESYREGFDVAIPHLKPDYDISQPLPISEKAQLNAPRKFLATFKGKRYIYGIGSEVRNQLSLLDNSNDVIMLTTCKHKDWQRYDDKNCEADMQRYDLYEYSDLLLNTTFALCPRGRRLASYRFHEIIASLGIPVILADNHILPFTEAIDWHQVALHYKEDSVLHVVDRLRAIPPSRIRQMQRLIYQVSTKVFHNVDTMMDMTFNIIFNRLFPLAAPDQDEADRRPYKKILDYKGLNKQLAESGEPRFVAVLFLQRNNFDGLFQTLYEIGKARNLGRVIVIINNHKQQDDHYQNRPWPRLDVPTEVYTVNRDSPSNRFLPIPSTMLYDGFLSLDEDIHLKAAELDLAFFEWLQKPHRLLGWVGRSHHFDETERRWVYSLKNQQQPNHYSIVLARASFASTIWLWRYWTQSPLEALQHVDQVSSCEDILFNFIVGNSSHRPPIKILTPVADFDTSLDPKETSSELETRSDCLNRFAASFTSMPLFNGQHLAIDAPSPKPSPYSTALKMKPGYTSSSSTISSPGENTRCAIIQPRLHQCGSGEMLNIVEWESDKSECSHAKKDSKRKVRMFTQSDQEEMFTVAILGHATRLDLLKGVLRGYDGKPKIKEILVIWGPPGAPPPLLTELGVNKTIIRFLVHFPTHSLNNRFDIADFVTTEAVLTNDDDMFFTESGLNIAFKIWQLNRHSVVGVSARGASNAPYPNKVYLHNNTCGHNIVLTNMAFLSTTLLREYSKRNGPTVAMRAHIDTVFNCEDIGMSFVSALAHPDGAPVQVLGAGWVNIIHSRGLSANSDHYSKRSECINKFESFFGQFPLRPLRQFSGKRSRTRRRRTNT